jgi:hypothetical protein
MFTGRVYIMYQGAVHQLEIQCSCHGNTTLMEVLEAIIGILSSVSSEKIKKKTFFLFHYSGATRRNHYQTTNRYLRACVSRLLRQPPPAPPTT